MFPSSWPSKRKQSSYYKWQMRSPLLGELAQRAEALGIYWGTWCQDGKRYAAFSGYSEDYDASQTDHLVRKLEYRRELTYQNIQLLDLPWLIILRRFNDYKLHSHSQPLLPKVDDLWKGWGDQGTTWYPHITMCYDEQNQTGCLSWLDSERDMNLVNALFFDLLYNQFNHKSHDSLKSNPNSEKVVNTSGTDIDPLTSLEDFESWSSRVQEVKELCREKKLIKAVLARSMVKEARPGKRWSGAKLFQRLMDKAQENEIPFAFSLSSHVAFVGLSPEKLFTVDHNLVQSHALAGTRVFQDPADNAEKIALSLELKTDQKDQQEHQIVVEQIKELLSPFCEQVSIGEQEFKQLRHLLHLETKIEGKLKPYINTFQLLESLHPTPALGGAPRRNALSIIEDKEPLHRGGYAAPWLWSNLKEEMTAVVGIRSALIHQNQAYVFAGAGIVAESIAELEWEETEAKAKVISTLLTHDICISTTSTEYEQSKQASLAQSSLQRCLNMVHRMIENGLAGAVISPGSRNTPLALALQHLLPSEVCVDERSAAFVALGWAKSSYAPIALCCTSGSAGAHYLPALIEAWHSAVPMIIMTADRPPRLRHRGAAQTINQANLYGHYVKQSFDLLVEEQNADPQTRLELQKVWAFIGQYAIEQAKQAPRSPIHLNIPFEEPLWDLSCDTILDFDPTHQQAELFPAQSTQGPLNYGSSALTNLSLVQANNTQNLIDDLKQALLQSKGLIYCGPLSPSDADCLKPLLQQIHEFSAWPVLTEASSQLRSETWGFSAFDAFARNTSKLHGEHPHPKQCDCLLMIGGGPHSRAVRAWLKQIQTKSAYYLGSGPDTVDPDENGLIRLGQDINDGLKILQTALKSASSDFDSLGASLKQNKTHKQSYWLQLWTNIETAWQSYVKTKGQLNSESLHSGSLDPLWGGSITRSLIQQLPSSLLKSNGHNMSPVHQPTQTCDLVIASSMAFRDHDMLWLTQSKTDIQARIWVNRGANGIDGTFSTALGIAKGLPSSSPLVIHLGDLACYHDIQGLHKLSQWHHGNQSPRPIIILMVNNDGGGIFQHLPIRQSKSFESLFQTSLSLSPKSTLDWAKLTYSLGWNHYRAGNIQKFSKSLERALSDQRLSFIEVMINPQLDFEYHQEFWQGFSEFVNHNQVGEHL